MNKLFLVSASAGSGKTHRLTYFYLRLLFGPVREDYFSRLLAVTFTNKATEEMKLRIIDELGKLANGSPSHYLEKLISDTGEPEHRLREKSDRLLKQVLHDYSWFSIETIDSFFQRVIRSFTREVGLPGNYAIEMDTGPVLDYAIDHLLEDVAPGSELLQWIVSFSEEKIAEGKSWDIRYDLHNLGRQLFNESFSRYAEILKERMHDRSRLLVYKQHLQELSGRILHQRKKIASEMLEAITENGFGADDLRGKQQGIHGYLLRASKGDTREPGTRVLSCLDDDEKWPSSSAPDKQAIISLAGKKLRPLFVQLVSHWEANKETFFTAREILKHINALGILADLHQYLVQYRHEKNSFLLADAPDFINRIIGENDTPFIYEKMGTRYNHFLIDEFQDTSVLQWKNFRPLIDNSLGSGHACLLVGDVKQSIYRWRNSDWEILAHGLEKIYPGEMLIRETLAHNWRSAGNIVAFNNAIFGQLPEMIAQILRESDATSILPEEVVNSLTTNLYRDAIQEIRPESKGKGAVTIKFFEKNVLKDDPGQHTDYLTEHINSLIQAGYQPGDIVCLVREGKEGVSLTKTIMEANAKGQFIRKIGVISNESLFIGSSLAVNLLVSAMRFLLQPEDRISRATLASTYSRIRHLQQVNGNRPDIPFESGFSQTDYMQSLLPRELWQERASLITLPLYDLAEALIRIFDLTDYQNEKAYTDAFLDTIHEYMQVNGSGVSGFLEFWEEEGAEKTVATHESDNAIRVLTIHKSKGLEFKAVILPWCNWNLNQKANSIFWSPVPEGPFDYLPVVPLSYSSSLAETVFASGYAIEYFKAHIDHLNLLYVSFTRAVDSLLVISDQAMEDKSGKISNVGKLLFQLLDGHPEAIPNGRYDKDSRELTVGEIPVPAQRPQTSSETEIVPQSTKPVTERLFFNPAGYDFFLEQSNSSRELAVKGIIFHSILQGVYRSEDLNREARKAVYEGLITADESKLLKEHFQEGIKDPLVASWFGGEAEIRNESDILLPSGEVRRPDRVVFFKESVHVIDYKFGGMHNLNLYAAQVQEYVELLTSMGYNGVRGFLWFIHSNQTIDINNLPKTN